MAQQTRHAAFYVNDATLGTVNWTSSVSNLDATDSTYMAIFGLPAGAATKYMKLTNFNFAIPAGSTPLGILLELLDKEASVANAIKDNAVRLVLGGVIQATDKSSAAAWLNVGGANSSHGGAADLWGATPTVADLNASNFGVAVSAKNVAASASDVLLNELRLTVYYSEPAAPDPPPGAGVNLSQAPAQYPNYPQLLVPRTVRVNVQVNTAAVYLQTARGNPGMWWDDEVFLGVGSYSFDRYCDAIRFRSADPTNLGIVTVEALPDFRLGHGGSDTMSPN